MTKYKKEVLLLLNIIVKPKDTLIDGVESSYDEKRMWILFAILYLPLIALILLKSSIIFKGSVSISILFAFVPMVTMIVALVAIIIPGIYYLLVRYIGKLDLSINDIRLSILPILIISYLMNGILDTVLFTTDFFDDLLNIIINLWVIIMISLYIKNKFLVTNRVLIKIMTLPVLFDLLIHVFTIFKLGIFSK